MRSTGVQFNVTILQRSVRGISLHDEVAALQCGDEAFSIKVGLLAVRGNVSRARKNTML